MPGLFTVTTSESDCLVEWKTTDAAIRRGLQRHSQKRFGKRLYVPRPPKVALRKKKIKEVFLCMYCKCRLDPHGNLNEGWTGQILCNRCARKLYFKCPRCTLIRSTTHREESGLHRHLCAMCNRHLRIGTPRVRDVYWGSGEPVRGGEYTLTGSNRTFGVEIETAQCDNVHKIEGKTVFGAKYDATVTGREFDSPILSGDAGLKVVTDFCDHATRRGWKVDGECGTHVHLGMQDEPDIATVQRIGYAFLLTYDVWEGLVAPERRRGNNEWCMKPPYTPTEYREWSFWDHCESVNRYHFFNFNSYRSHKTIEVRALQGTLDKTLISNWICALVRFADLAAKSGYKDLDAMFRNKSEKVCWNSLKKHIGPTARYWGRVRANYAKR